MIGILILSANYYLPTADAPQIRMTLYDADGVKTVGVGETAEYVIKVENIGGSREHVTLDHEGDAEGWSSGMSHSELLIQPGDHRRISLYVSPNTGEAEPVFNVNVVATRGDNITQLVISTYLKGNVSVLPEGEVIWVPLDPIDTIGEGDRLKTGDDSYGQFDLGEDASFVLKPNSELQVKYSHAVDLNKTYHFILNTGAISFDVTLPTETSTFTLELPNGNIITINSTENTVFDVEADGTVRVFDGELSITAPDTRQGGDQITILTRGMDSEGNTFDFIKLYHQNDVISGILTNVQGDKIGMDNDGNFVAEGTLDGFLLRDGETDTYFVYGLDSTSLTYELTSISTGTFDLIFLRFAPDLKGFYFNDVDTPSKGTAMFKFKEDEAYIASSSELNYDLEIRHLDTSRFYLNEMTLYADEGNNYKVLNYEHLANDEVNTVQFGRDENGDGTVDDDTLIHTDLTGKQVYDGMDDEDSSSFLYLVVGALVIILLILAMFFALQSGERDSDNLPESFDGLEESSSEPQDEPEMGSDDEMKRIIPPMGLYDKPDEDEKMEDDTSPLSERSDDDANLIDHPDDGEGPIEEEKKEETDDIFDGPSEEEIDGEDDESPESFIPEDLVERRKDLILDEDYETLPPVEPPETMDDGETDTMPGYEDEIGHDEVGGDDDNEDDYDKDVDDDDEHEKDDDDKVEHGEGEDDADDEDDHDEEVGDEDEGDDDDEEGEDDHDEEVGDEDEGDDDGGGQEKEDIFGDDLDNVMDEGIKDPDIPVKELASEEGVEGYPEQSDGISPESMAPEKPYEEGDEIFDDLEKKLFTGDSERNGLFDGESDGSQSSEADSIPAGVSSDETSNEEDDGPGYRELSREDIQNSLAKVREIRKEMDGIEGEDAKDSWWNQWSQDVQKDMSDLFKKDEE